MLEIKIFKVIFFGFSAEWIPTKRSASNSWIIRFNMTLQLAGLHIVRGQSFITLGIGAG